MKYCILENGRVNTRISDCIKKIMTDRKIPHFFSLHPSKFMHNGKMELVINFHRLNFMIQYLVLPAKAYQSRKLPLIKDGKYIDKNPGELSALQKMST